MLGMLGRERALDRRILKIKYLFILAVYFWTHSVRANEFMFAKTQAVSFLDCNQLRNFHYDWNEDLEEKIVKLWDNPLFQESDLLIQIRKKIKIANLKKHNLKFNEYIILEILCRNDIYFNNLFNNRYLQKYLVQKKIIKNDSFVFEIYSGNKVSERAEQFYSKEFFKFYNNLSKSEQNFLAYLKAACEGLFRAEYLSKGYFSLLRKQKITIGRGGVIELGFRLRKARAEFIFNLLPYAQTKQISFPSLVALTRFQNGGSVFLSHNAYKQFILNDNKFLGRKGVIFITAKSTAEKILHLYNKHEIERILGLPKGSLSSGIVKYSLPFSFNYLPDLPHNSTIGRNAFFKYGGFTSGNAPELIFTNVPKSDIQSVEYIQ
ncbi:hypothetical protein [Fluviispira vulneris]|uniref:hypothetical protein n=1 Tax=Fluviispira vulneris TaxID=2763012 RepID=UPI001645F5D6|nr:hypothetical protein [Fluviispira vulneris]